MKTALISFTARGSRLCAQLYDALSLRGYVCCAYGIEKYAPEYGLQTLDMPLKEWTGKMFQEADALLFIGACGIAVRSIAPYVQDKTRDPAVVVMDEKGIFAVSLLSGHLGGANELAGTLSDLTGAIPVITTATDVNGRFAVDLFAKKNNLKITEMIFAKEISADVLDEKIVGFKSDFPVEGNIPQEIQVWNESEVFEGTNGILVSLNGEAMPYKQTLHLIPRIVTVGIGCRRGKTMEEIESAVQKVLKVNGIPTEAVCQVSSIDIKEQEQGILDFCEKYELPFETFTTEELEQVEGEYTESAFVKTVTGVSNVCERSAMRSAKKGCLLQKKVAENGVTVALAQKEWSVEFE